MSNLCVNIDEVTDLLFRAWKRVVDKESARRISTAIVKTALQKDDRLKPVEDAVDDLTSALRIQSKCIETVKKGAIRSYDLCGMPAIAFMPALTDQAVSLAKEFGVGIITIRNSGGVDTLSTWLLELPAANCIGLFIWNGGSYTTVPFGSTEPFFGTNPVAYAIPTNEKPLLLDMSTSGIPFMNLMRAIESGTPLPDKAGIDESGNDTTDPNLVYDVEADSDVKLLPMGGGYKGSAVMLLVEVLTGALINSKMAREATSTPQIPEEFGGILVALDIATFTEPSKFKSRVTNMILQIRGSKPAAGCSGVKVPGDRSLEREQKRRQSGVIEMSSQCFSDLKELSRAS